MTQGNSSNSDNSKVSKSNSISHSKKYKKFVATNALVFLVSRVLSIIYVYTVTRLIRDETMALMIILATFQSIFVNLIPIGFSYAAKQRTLSAKEYTDRFLKNYFSYTFFVSFPLMIFSSLLLLNHTGLPLISVNSLLYLAANILALFLEVLRNTEVALYNTDKATLLSGFYSILNSIMVPSFYFFFTQDLTSVLLAWVIALIIVILSDIRAGFQFFSITVAYSEWKEMLIFSLPIWVTTGLNIFSVQINRIFIYEMFDYQSLNTFHWVDKNLMIGLQLVSLLLAGVYSMLVKLRSEDYEKFKRVSRAMFRIISIAGVFVFLGFFSNAEFIVPFLLGEKYERGIEWMKILSFAYILQSVINFLLIRFLANENRFETIFIRGGGLIIRIIVALILLPMQVNGLLIAILFSALITLIALISLTKELYSWNKHHIIRYSVFLLIDILLVVTFDQLFVWPLNNVSLILLLVMMVVFKPLEKQDIIYIERIIPKFGNRFIRPFLHKVSYTTD